jgi:Lipocalin-like domain
MKRRMFVAASAGLIAGNIPITAWAQPTSWRSRVLGSWSLVDAVAVSGDEIKPWAGRQTPITGIIMYLDSGWMSVQISGARPGVISREDFEKLKTDDRAKWLNEYYAYYGKFEVNESSRVITHYLTDALLPYEQAIVYKRSFKLDGDVLTLLTEPRVVGGKTVFNRLVWKKAA